MVITAVVVAISAWALSGQTSNSNMNQNTEVLATSIINEGYKYKNVFMQKTIGQDVSLYNNLLFSPNVVNPLNLLDPNTGASWEPINQKALVVGAQFPKGYWAYNKRFFTASATGSAVRDPTFLVAGLSEPVCKKINLILHRSEVIPVYTYDYDVTDDITRTNAITTNIISMHYEIATAKWLNGCINRSNNPNDNFYFQVAQIN